MVKPKDEADIRFAARLVIDGFMDQAMMQKVLESQDQLIAKGKPLTIAQICLRKKWLTRAEARILLSPESPPSDLVEGYEIVGLLGQGGMSWVYDAVSGDGKPTALKVLKPNLKRRELALSRFRHEADLLIRFEHENIVKGYDVVESDGLVAFAMERVPGGELLELLDQAGPFHEDAALYVVLQIARALNYMYGQGVVHRDVKPGNILITSDNTIKLCDLGLATGSDEGAAEGMTVGTVEYISPEQALGDDAVDVRSDIYALGVTLYHLVVGEIPFKGEDDQETMAKRFVESLSSPKLSHVSPHMHYFIQKMMATDKDIRYQSPEELIEDVEESIRGKKTLTVSPGGAGEDALQLKRPFGEKDDRKTESSSVKLTRTRRPGRNPGKRRR